MREQRLVYLCEEGAQLLKKGDEIKINGATDVRYYSKSQKIHQQTKQ